MTQDPDIKKFPATTSEVAKMLGLPGGGQDLPMGTVVSAADLPVPDLPVAVKDEGHLDAKPKLAASGVFVPAGEAGAKSEKPHGAERSLEQISDGLPVYIKAGKAILPYAAVFVLGIFLYFFFFTKVDFSSILKPQTQAATPKDTVAQQLEKTDMSGYNAWIAGYYYDVSDPGIIDPNTDNSGNGLSNFQKYLLNLNPKAYDTLGLGMADSQAIAMGVNPLTGGALTDAQKSIISKYIDMEVVQNRLTLYNLQNPGRVAGADTVSPGGSAIGSNSNAAAYHSFPLPNSAVNSQSPAGTTGVRGPSQSGTSDPISISKAALVPISDSQVNINTDVPGLLEIPDLKIRVPVIWSKDPNNFDKDLQSGVVHYPGTALPGQAGTAYISGHSSNYIWAKGSYNQIFSRLGDVAMNTSFKITVTQTNGKTAVFNYVVTGSKQYSPTDQAQFANSDKSVVALSTCWPVGSTAKRLVVFGELTQVQE